MFHAAAGRPEFLPPPEPGLLRSVTLALLAHVVLVLALSWGIHWKRDDNTVAVEAEIWSAAVQQAAPKPVETPPTPKVDTTPPPPPPPAPTPPQQRDAEIAIEREKERLAQEKALQQEQARKAAAEEAERREAADRRRKQEEARKEEAAKKAAEERKRAEQTVAREKREQEERLAKQRAENLKRIQGMAGATGVPGSEGLALRSSGPSDSYGGRIRAKVRPNIVFSDDISGNPSAEVLVRLAPDGTIVGTKIRKESGQKSWDDAVLRALARTEVFPRDVDGRVPPEVVLVFRPRD
ncbi:MULTISPECIES: cell envelope integrity protein TolA [Ramlibacter]|uniref:Protein TolA n=1 Tax=Ramlibacter pinisoli TaxID=2682844 RepID=A0A6N8IP11_9BURK|nr:MULTISPECIES: cell envelope integrity protein TolA [Ramlibacter]MBA2963485.1 cell envelope integrity protein TolA [Ramlibacter sp. CGMCC 1.13660]MVQ28452.1 protein TolA [Ramlibacter pinisoli]